MADRILRRPEVERRVGLARPTIYKLIQQGRFPRPVKLTGRSVGWHEQEIAEWIASRERVQPHAAHATP
ncbi:helix-turn-helix transcriptional regulator [Candidatus Palauibacter sp.]|uniref:helix-turn-helix transcriptional regulator n=1 Tax=Candidatus Palauibacter sp. TaxID=3101350 RepID=UPI003B020099